MRRVATKIFLTFAVALAAFALVAVFGIVRLHELRKDLRLLSGGYLALTRIAAQLDVKDWVATRALEARGLDRAARQAYLPVARAHFPALVREKIEEGRRVAHDARALARGDDARFLDEVSARLDALAAEARRVLAPDGVLVLALFADGTLRELRDAWRSAANGAAEARLHRFFTREDVASALRGAGLAPRALEEEDLVERHRDARAVLRSIRAVGASSAVPGARGLGGRGAIVEALRIYEARHGGPDGVPATYHVVYAVARPA